MTRQQTIAINNPCELAEQCIRQLFRTMVPIGKNLFASVMLTVNVGEERTLFYRGRALWMVSVALLVKPFGPVPRPMWSAEQKTMARRIALEMLAGVGIENTDVPDDGDITLIIRRQGSDDERRRVTEKYLKL